MMLIFWILFSYSFISFFEYTIHKYLMHRDNIAKSLTRLPKISNSLHSEFHSHTHLHHGKYYKEFDYEEDEWGREHNLTIGWGQTMIILIFISPVLIPLFYFYPLGGTILLSLIILHNRLWGIIHTEMHIPTNGLLFKNPLYRFWRNYHYVHHEHTNKNFNVIFPLFDYILGTYRSTS